MAFPAELKKNSLACTNDVARTNLVFRNSHIVEPGFVCAFAISKLGKVPEVLNFKMNSRHKAVFGDEEGRIRPAHGPYLTLRHKQSCASKWSSIDRQN